MVAALCTDELRQWCCSHDFTNHFKSLLAPWKQYSLCR